MSLTYTQLYERLFDHKGTKGKEQHAFTTTSSSSLASSDASLSARRSTMGGVLLRILMTICEMSKEWSDPAKIPEGYHRSMVRLACARGRYEVLYEHAMWRAAGLKDPDGKPAGKQGREPSKVWVPRARMAPCL